MQSMQAMCCGKNTHWNVCWSEASAEIRLKSAILHGAIIENYPDDHPIPSILLAVNQPEALHVVLAYDAASEQCHIITAYRPDLTHFELDLITRRLS